MLWEDSEEGSLVHGDWIDRIGREAGASARDEKGDFSGGVLVLVLVR